MASFWLKTLLLGLFLSSMYAQGAGSPGRTIGLAWEEHPQAIGYELRFERIGRSSKAIFFKTKTTEFSGTLKPGEYRFYLRAYDKKRKPGEWSEAQSVAVAPLAVSALIPAPDASLSSKDFPGGEVEFRWQRVPGEHEYEFKLANADNTYVKVLKTKSNRLKFKLPTGNTFRWSVQAFTEGGTPGDPWESPSQFSYTSPQLEAPQIAKNASYGSEGLAWTAVPGAKHYRAKLLYQEFFSEDWILVESQLKLTSPRFIAKEGALKPGQYKLSITAQADGWTDSGTTDFLFVVKPVERNLASIPDEIAPETIASEKIASEKKK